MEDRPEELRRQRELIAAHLRWLDEQIARSSAATPPLPSPRATPPAPLPHLPPAQPVSIPAAEAAAPSADAEVLAGFAMPEVDPNSIRSEVKRGCMIYVIAVSLLLAASLAVAWWIAVQE